MNDISINLTFPQVDALLPGIIPQLGYPGAEAVSSQVLAKIHDSISICRDLEATKVMCRTTPFKNVTKKAILGEGICLETVNWSRLTARMTGVHDLCCVAVTLGKRIDEEIGQLGGKGAMLDALILDTVASILGESYANQIQEQIADHCLQAGLKVTDRFSPGYCDWPLLSGQKSLFGFLGPEAIGIRISSSGLMTPRKSITSVVVSAESMPAQTPCYYCARECSHRRAASSG